MNLLYNEIFKMIANRKITVFLILTVVVVFLPSLTVFVPEVDAGFSGQNYAINTLAGTVSMLFPLLIVVMLAEMIGTEYERGTLKNSLIQPVARNQVLLAKMAAVIVILAFLLLVSMLLSYAIGTLLYGWGEGIITGEGRISGVEGIITTVVAYGVSLIPLVSFALLILVICVAIPSGTASIGIGIGLFFGMSLFGQLVEQVQTYLITSHFSLYIYVVETGLREHLWTSLAVLLVYASLSMVLAIQLFKKKQILL